MKHSASSLAKNILINKVCNTCFYFDADDKLCKKCLNFYSTTELSFCKDWRGIEKNNKPLTKEEIDEMLKSLGIIPTT